MYIHSCVYVHVTYVRICLIVCYVYMAGHLYKYIHRPVIYQGSRKMKFTGGHNPVAMMSNQIVIKFIDVLKSNCNAFYKYSMEILE